MKNISFWTFLSAIPLSKVRKKKIGGSMLGDKN